MRIRAAILIALFLVVIMAMTSLVPVQAQGLQQISTGSVPTVTGTPAGAYIVVKLDQQQINVRSGPGRLYPQVGVLLANQEVPAKGRSSGGEWIMIEYLGVSGGTAWVYSPLVDLIGGDLPVVEPPPTPTLLYTSTIDPTLAAQFVVTDQPTTLPTYTPPAPLVIPTFTTNDSSGFGKVPMGLVILVLLSTGVIIGMFTVAQGR